ncbi:MAG: ATP-binding protein [Myxococcales bacterium]|nr:ATP-binding protein [Myxococcales bacterium]MDH3486076.1 ATP-binding protein [Myxococcales bacterium]
MKSIVNPRRRTEEPTIPAILGALNQAQDEAGGVATDENILRAYVHALENLYPKIRFAMRLARQGAAEPTAVVQTATHHIATEALHAVTITEAGLVRSGLWEAAPALGEITLQRTYQPILEAPPDDAPFSDGFDAPLTRGGEVIGVLLAEFDRREPLPANLETAAVIAASQASATLEIASRRREASHLRDYVGKLLEHANIPVLVVGRDRGVRVVSSAFARITGIAPDRLIAKDLLQLAPQSERVHLLSAFVGALRGRNVAPFELQLPRAKGGSARLSFKLAPILDSEGRVAGVIAIGQDRTEVRELEGQVIHAERLATLGQLAAGIVHEINNPLTSISVYGEYLLGKLTRSGAESSDLKRIERILRSSDRIMSFTRNLLTYARPSKEEAREVAVNEIIGEAVDFCDHLIRESNITVIPDYAEGLPRIQAVPGQLHQVFVNVITNACNAAGEDGGVVLIRTRRHGNDQIEIVVEDNGIGIPEGHLEQVFEPFFSTRRKGKGTGLGLSIVRNIVEQHKGRIQIDSKPGERTTVSIVLPCPAEG